MNHTEQRKKLRAIFAGTKCLSPAGVVGPLSARVAEAVGYEVGMIAGSEVSHETLAAPDLLLLTLTELATQVRRIARVSKLSLLVDGDDGYGNALNVMRTVQELEHAGASGLTIEDTQRKGTLEGEDELVSVEEMVGKLRAALRARQDPSLMIIGRTAALRTMDTETTIVRAKAFAATGVDAIMLRGLQTLEQIEAIHAAVKLPIMLGMPPESLKREDLAARGARIKMQNHEPVAAMVKALHDTYTHLFNGGAPADLRAKIASAQQMAALLNSDSYQNSRREYVR
jgi:carboxyvinyl-carboxyphosphonate phosphorylmutase